MEEQSALEIIYDLIKGGAIPQEDFYEMIKKLLVEGVITEEQLSKCNPNFLDILNSKINGLIEEGVITEEDITKGIEIDESWIFHGKLPFTKAMVGLLISRNPNSYFKKCEINKKKKLKTNFLKIKRENGKIQIEVNGNDEFSKFIITNEKDTSGRLLEITPEEFEAKVLEVLKNDDSLDIGLYKFIIANMGNIKYSNIRQEDFMLEFVDALAEKMHLSDIEKEKFKLEFINALNKSREEKDDETIEKLRDSEVTGERIHNDLNEMARDFPEYYKYLIHEKQRAEQYKKEHPYKIIEGKFIDISQDKGGTKGSKINETKERVNDEISFEDRDEFLSSLLKESDFVVKHHTLVEGQTIRPYNVYIYDMNPKRDGKLLIFEPYSGKQVTRAIYLPDEILDKFLIEGQEKDDSYWNDVTEYFAEMSKNDFMNEPNSANINHTSRQNYFDTLEEIIDIGRTGEKN